MTERSKKMLADLDPRAKHVFEAFLTKLDAMLGENQYIVFEGRRKKAVQEAYFAQGRMTLEEVNEIRRSVNLYLLRSEKDNYIITWTMKSKHLDGLAMDVLPVDGAGNPTWDLAHFQQQFNTIRDCGKETGLVCGADWTPNKDWPHYEINLMA